MHNFSLPVLDGLTLNLSLRHISQCDTGLADEREQNRRPMPIEGNFCSNAIGTPSHMFDVCHSFVQMMACD